MPDIRGKSIKRKSLLRDYSQETTLKLLGSLREDIRIFSLLWKIMNLVPLLDLPTVGALVMPQTTLVIH